LVADAQCYNRKVCDVKKGKQRERTRFFEKKRGKKLLSWWHGRFQQHGHPEQKFFAELFFKKATAFFCLPAFCHCAHAQLLDTVLPDGIPGYGTPFAVAVTNRTRPADATGLELGSFSAVPEFSLSQGYESAPNNTAGSPVTQLAPSLLLADPLAGFGAYAAGNVSDYTSNAAQNISGLTLGAGQRAQLPQQTITLSAGYLRTEETAFALNTIAITRPVAFTVADFRASDLITAGEFTLTPEASFTQYRFPRFAAQNRIDTREAITASFVPGGPMDVLARVESTQSAYRESLFNADTNQALAGFSDTASGLWTLRALAGLARREPRLGGATTAPVLEAGLDWSPSDFDQVRLSLAREIDDPDAVSASPYTLTQARLAATHNTPNGITLKFAASLANADYLHGPLRETLASTSMNLEFRISETLAIAAGYNYDTCQANALRATNDHIITLSLTWTP